VNHRPEVTGRRAGVVTTEVATVRPQPPPAFLPVDEGCVYLGISRTALYERLMPLDPGIVIQFGGRTLVDVARATALIASMPRGPRKPLGLPRAVKGTRRRQTPPKSARSSHLYD
jgi:hypothetical protein